MTVVAYANLVYLLNTLDQIQIQIHPLLSTSFNNYPNQSLRTKIEFLVDFVENYSDADSCREAEDLLSRIAFVAHEAEDIIEVRAADLIHAATSTQQSQTFLPNLQRVIDRMDFIKEQIIKLKEETRNRQPTSSMPTESSSSSSVPLATAMVENSSEAADLICDEQSPSVLPDMQIRKEEETGSMNQQPASSSSSSASAKTTNMVGLDRYLKQLLDQLTGHNTSRQILTIVGMGGIGKTTLARNVYDNLLMVGHFYVRAWVTVSQEFLESDKH